MSLHVNGSSGNLSQACCLQVKIQKKRIMQKMKKRISLFFLSAMLLGLPALSNLSSSISNIWAIAGIWSEDKVLQTGAVVIEVGAGAALAVGAICPPQFVGFAVVGG